MIKSSHTQPSYANERIKVIDRIKTLLAESDNATERALQLWEEASDLIFEWNNRLRGKDRRSNLIDQTSIPESKIWGWLKEQDGFKQQRQADNDLLQKTKTREHTMPQTIKTPHQSPITSHRKHQSPFVSADFVNKKLQAIETALGQTLTHVQCEEHIDFLMSIPNRLQKIERQEQNAILTKANDLKATLNELLSQLRTGPLARASNHSDAETTSSEEESDDVPSPPELSTSKSEVINASPITKPPRRIEPDTLTDIEDIIPTKESIERTIRTQLKLMTKKKTAEVAQGYYDNALKLADDWDSRHPDDCISVSLRNEIDRCASLSEKMTATTSNSPIKIEMPITPSRDNACPTTNSPSSSVSPSPLPWDKHIEITSEGQSVAPKALMQPPFSRSSSSNIAYEDDKLARISPRIDEAIATKNVAEIKKLLVELGGISSERESVTWTAIRSIAHECNEALKPTGDDLDSLIAELLRLIEVIESNLEHNKTDDGRTALKELLTKGFEWHLIALCKLSDMSIMNRERDRGIFISKQISFRAMPELKTVAEQLYPRDMPAPRTVTPVESSTSVATTESTVSVATTESTADHQQLGTPIPAIPSTLETVTIKSPLVTAIKELEGAVNTRNQQTQKDIRRFIESIKEAAKLLNNKNFDDNKELNSLIGLVNSTTQLLNEPNVMTSQRYLQKANDWNKSHPSRKNNVIAGIMALIAACLIAAAIVCVPMLAVPIAATFAASSLVATTAASATFAAPTALTAVSAGFFGFRKNELTRRMSTITGHLTTDNESSTVIRYK